MNKLIAAAIALSLAGCASAPQPQMMVMSHRAPVVKMSPAPVVAPASVAAGKPLTFKERFRATFKRHPIKLVH